MAGTSAVQTTKKQRPIERVADAGLEFDELDELGSVEASESAAADSDSEKLLFAKSTDVRRRIEEKLEVRLLRDELGIDDLDIE